MKLKVKQASVLVERGDITDWEVDAIVNAANSTLAMGAGVAAAIKRKGGVIIEEDAMRQGPIEVGEAVLTTAANLPATHVIHAAALGPDLKADATKIGAAAMVTTVLDHLKGGTSSLKRVVFVLYQDEAYKAFTDVLKHLGGVQ